ncbi:MAG TPA: M20 family metallopeptidase [Candidatus Aphodousia faecigallinarum]|uniref:M20 family metallopeptidase n=1 Tax=Candidatus Aphodousia faecigallinarum TaxID=2840677 RepID=A0A9D1IL41_9BURK|nr:M20 family metallopeptidase [Candidatus Aphodousia faecigallinarum]
MPMVQEFLKDLEKVVNVDAGTACTEGVKQVAETFKQHYESIGFTAKLVDLGDKVGPALFATNKPEATHYDVMLNAHLDTVFPAGTVAVRPMSIKGDRAYGPGVLDCKAGCMTIFYALKNLPKETLDKLSILVACNPDEETGSVSSHDWLKECASKSDRALIFEPAREGGELVCARKGSSTYKITFHGVSAHAGNNPERGRDAIYAMVKFIAAVKELADWDRGITLNFGMVRGGTVANVVADFAETELDLRVWNDDDYNEVNAKIMELAKKEWVAGVTQEIVEKNHHGAMPLSEATKAMAGLIEEAAKLEGFDIAWVKAGGASDGNTTASMGVPTLDGLGPVGGEMHCDREYLEINSIEKHIKVAERFLTLIAERK